MFLKTMEGKTQAVIARELKHSVNTISAWRARFMKKFGVKNDVELTKYAIKNGLVTL